MSRTNNSAVFDPNRYYRSNASELDVLGTPSTRAKWRCMNVGPQYTKSGKAILYHGADLLAWLAANRVKTVTPEMEAA